jgi:hypothetical protein
MPTPRFNPKKLLREIAGDATATAASRLRAARTLIAETEKSKRPPERPNSDPLLRHALALVAERYAAPDAMPVQSEHRGVPLHCFQDTERIERIVRPHIDRALDERDPVSLFQMAADPTIAPEARLAAASLVTAICSPQVGAHRRSAVDLDLVEAAVAGIASLGWADPSRYVSLLCAPGGAPRPPEQAAAIEAAWE